MIKYVIDEEYDGVRLDRFVRKKLKNTSLTEIFKMLRTGKIKVNGKKKKRKLQIKSFWWNSNLYARWRNKNWGRKIFWTKWGR